MKTYPVKTSYKPLLNKLSRQASSMIKEFIKINPDRDKVRIMWSGVGPNNVFHDVQSNRSLW